MRSCEGLDVDLVIEPRVYQYRLLLGRVGNTSGKSSIFMGPNPLRTDVSSAGWLNDPERYIKRLVSKKRKVRLTKYRSSSSGQNPARKNRRWAYYTYLINTTIE